MFKIFNKKRKIKSIPKKDRHKPSLILTKDIDKSFSKKNRNKSHINFKAIFFGIFGILLLLGIIYLFNLFFTNSNYKLQSIILLGNKTVTEEEIVGVVGSNKDKNLLLINTNELSAEIIKAFPIINGIDITKLYPNKILIKFNEREPKMNYINLNGAYVIDAKGYVLTKVKSQPIDFSEEKIAVARGVSDYNSKIIKEYFLAEFIKSKKFTTETEEEKQKIILAEYNFDNIAQANKLGVLEQLRQEYLREITDIFTKNANSILASKNKDLPKVYVLENKEWEGDEQVNIDKENLSLTLFTYLSARNMEYNQFRWEGAIIVKVILKDERTIIFGTTRGLTEQWEDYLLVLNDLTKRGKGYSSIDVSSTKVSVTN